MLNLIFLVVRRPRILLGKLYAIRLISFEILTSFLYFGIFEIRMCLNKFKYLIYMLSKIKALIFDTHDLNNSKFAKELRMFSGVS